VIRVRHPHHHHQSHQLPARSVGGWRELAGIVWKFFEKIESVLKDDTKLEIALLLLGVETELRLRSGLQSGVVALYASAHSSRRAVTVALAAVASSLLVIWPAGVRVWHGPHIINALHSRPLSISLVFMVLTLVFYSAVVFVCVAGAGSSLPSSSAVLKRDVFAVAFGFLGFSCIPAISIYYFMVAAYLTFFRSDASVIAVAPLSDAHLFAVVVHKWGLWGLSSLLVSFSPLLLYVGAADILLVARRFDIAFQWFDSKVDIEKKPLSAIGLVAGALVALVYWAAVVVGRVL
jgi:hypothetical protein